MGLNPKKVEFCELSERIIQSKGESVESIGDVQETGERQILGDHDT